MGMHTIESTPNSPGAASNASEIEFGFVNDDV